MGWPLSMGLIFACLLIILPLPVFAQAAVSDSATRVQRSGTEQTLSEQITDPVSTLSAVVLQNIFVPSSYDADGYANELSIEPTLAFTIDNFPDQIVQLTIPVLTTTADGANGFGDLELLEVSILAGGGEWGGWGLGPALVFPTATQEQTGDGKWQAGVTMALAVLSIPNMQIGFIAYNLTSFAGDSSRADVNTLFFEPLLIYQVTDAWYVGWGDMDIEFNWANGGAVNFPVNVQVGRLFDFDSFALDIQVEPFWFPIHDGENPQWGVQLGFIFPIPAL